MAPPDTTTTSGESRLFQLELVQETALSEQETIILGVFSRGIYPATPEAAAEAAHRFDVLCPPLDQEDEAYEYLLAVWKMMLTVVTSPDVTTEIHIQLVSILDNLGPCAKGTVDAYGGTLCVWRDFPHLALRMEEFFFDPIINLEEFEEFSPKAAQTWKNMNSFAARCIGAGVAGPYSNAMYAMRSALEEDLSTTPEMSMAECKIQVACEWIAHASRQFLWWARENIGYTNVTVDDEEGQYVEGGPLYHGPPAMCLQRWAFWLGRFEEFGKGELELNEETRRAALETARSMRTIESNMAPTFLEYRPGTRSWQSLAPEPPPEKMYRDI